MRSYLESLREKRDMSDRMKSHSPG